MKYYYLTRSRYFEKEYGDICETQKEGKQYQDDFGQQIAIGYHPHELIDDC